MHDPSSLYTQMWEPSHYEMGIDPAQDTETVISRARRAVAPPRPCPEGRNMSAGITDKRSLLTYASHLERCSACRRAWVGSEAFGKGLSVSLCSSGMSVLNWVGMQDVGVITHEAFLAFREHLRTCPTCGHPRICDLGETLVSLMQDAAQSLDFDEAEFNARAEAVTQHGHTCPQCAAVLGYQPVAQAEPDYAYKTTLAGHLKSFWSK